LKKNNKFLDFRHTKISERSWSTNKFLKIIFILTSVKAFSGRYSKNMINKPKVTSIFKFFYIFLSWGLCFDFKIYRTRQVRERSKKFLFFLFIFNLTTGFLSKLFSNKDHSVAFIAGIFSPLGF